MRRIHSNVKPLTRWVIYRGYKVRFARRAADEVTGVLTTPEGEVGFRYDPVALVVHLPNERIAINEYGWELKQAQVNTS
jgi:hypothetical protein